MTKKPSIKQPCPQNWDEMTICGDGRFCGVCQKVVVDFTTMNNSEVAAYLANKTNSVCGRFEASQLHNPFAPFVRRMLTGAAAVAALLLTLPAIGQQKTVVNNASIPYTIAPNPSYLKIHGVVLLENGEKASKPMFITVYNIKNKNEIMRIKTKKGGVFNVIIPCSDPNEQVVFQISGVRAKNKKDILSVYKRITVSDIDPNGYLELQLHKRFLTGCPRF